MTDEKKRFDVNPDHDPPGVETPRAGGSDFEWSREFSILFSDEFKLVPSKDARLTTTQHEEICDYAQAQVAEVYWVDFVFAALPQLFESESEQRELL